MPEVNIGRTTVGTIPVPGSQTGHPPTASNIQSRGSSSLAETRSLASFPLRTPSYTAGFGFLQAGIMSEPRRAVVMSYTGPNKERGFELFQAPVGQYQADATAPGKYFVVGDSLAAGRVGSLNAAVSVMPPPPGRTQPAIGLVWEQGDVLYHLVSQGLSQEELSRIGASVA